MKSEACFNRLIMLLLDNGEASNNAHENHPIRFVEVEEISRGREIIE